MSTPFQNRLVGTVIVAAVLIIFLPDVLDGDKNQYQADFGMIPEPPKTIKIQVKKDFPRVKFQNETEKEISDEKALDDLDSFNEAVIQKTNPIPKEKMINKRITKPLPEKASNQKAWVVQLGSFRHKKNVDELLSKLKKQGFTAFTKPIKTKNGNLTKVFVGPELIKNNLLEMLPKLKDLTGVQGKVSRFYPQS